MLLDPVRDPAPRSPLTSQAPTQLIHRHREPPTLSRVGELERSRHRRAASADDRYALWSLAVHLTGRPRCDARSSFSVVGKVTRLMTDRAWSARGA